jgi:hypothetical protein
MAIGVPVNHGPECPWHRDWHACNCGLFDFVQWSDPDEAGNPILRHCTVEVAVEQQIETARRHGHVYSTWQDALADFLTLHWGTVLHDRKSDI